MCDKLWEENGGAISLAIANYRNLSLAIANYIRNLLHINEEMMATADKNSHIANTTDMKCDLRS